MKKRFLKVTALCAGILYISIAGFSLIKDISVTACAEEITASGTIENLEWCISNDVLTISGEGDMPYLEKSGGENVDASAYPWWEYGSKAFSYYDNTKFHTVIIEEGITSISECAFASMSNITEVKLPSTLKKVNDFSFYCDNNLKFIQLPDTLEELGEASFMNCQSLESIKIGNNITTINNSTFLGCKTLKEVIISNSVTEIGEDAFFQCNQLTFIALPENLKTIGNDAFKNSGLESITISSETEYGTGVFSDCRKLKTISTDSTISKIPDNFLNNCVSLSDVSNILGENTLSIGQEAFSNCNITEITIPDSVQTIGNGAFRACKSLEKATLPENCSVIPYEMFSDCKKLSDIILPDSIETIGNNSFKNCKSLQQITLPENILSIGDSAFQNCALTSITLPENLKSIGSLAFAVNKTFKNIIIPDSVENIYSDSFTNTESLTIGASAKIQYNYSNDNVYTLNNKQIKINCFKDASTLKKLIVNENNPYYCSEDSVLYNKDKSIIYDVAATHCFKNGTMIIPSSVLKIDNILNSKNIRKFEVEEENTTFSSINGALTSKDKKTLIQYPNGRKERDYIIPELIQTIAENAFYMSDLSSVVFSDSVTSIQSWAFLKSNIASISFSKTLNEIKDYAFYYSKTPVLSIPKSVSKIGSNICSSDTKTIIFDYNEEDSPEISNTMTNISSISYYAYDNSCISTQFPKQFISRSAYEKGSCGKNLIWELNGGDLVISGAGEMDEYSGKSFPWLNKNILKVTIKGKDITIAPYAFQYNTTLSDVYLSGVTKIGDSAFYNCKSLLNVFIDDSPSYTYIANRAFYNCNNIQKLSVPRNNIYYYSTAFENNSSITHLRWSDSNTNISLEEFMEAGKNRTFQTIYNEKTDETISDWCYSKNNTLVQLAENLYNTPYMDSLREKYFENILHENNCTVDSSDKDLIKAICNYLKNDSAPGHSYIEDEYGAYTGNDTNWSMLPNMSNDYVSVMVGGIGACSSYAELIGKYVSYLQENGFSENIKQVQMYGTGHTWNAIGLDTGTENELWYYTDALNGSYMIGYENSILSSNSSMFSYDSSIPKNNDNTYTITLSDGSIINLQGKDMLFESESLYGDANGNGSIDVDDASIVLSYYAQKAAGLNVEGKEEFKNITNGDVDKNNEISVDDASFILSYYAKNAAGLNPTWDNILNSKTE